MDIHTHSYRLSYSEWLTGLRLARKRSPVSMLRFVCSWLIPALLLYLLAAITWNAIREKAVWSDAGPSITVLALLLLTFSSYRILRRRRISKRSAVVRNEHGIAIAFNDEYFVAGLHGLNEGRFLWSALYDFAENDTVAIIYTSKKSFVVVPKHAIPPDSWVALRTLAPQRKPKVHAD